jgi:hypothetical protein
MRPLNRFGSAAAISLALALALTPALQAQTTKYFGFVGGATLSDFSDTYGAYSTSSRWGGNAGVILGLRTTNRMTFAVEPAWTQMGAEFTGTSGKTSASLDYVEVPITIGGMAEAANEKIRYGGYTGIMPAFKLSCSIAQPAGACDLAKSSAWFLPIGLRVLSSTGKGTFVGLDIRYSIPLGSSFDTAVQNGGSVHQRSWAFRLVFAKGDL